MRTRLMVLVIPLLMSLTLAACGGSTHKANPGSSTHNVGHSAPGTASCTIPQNNGGDHDADNNGGPSDGDGCDK